MKKATGAIVAKDLAVVKETWLNEAVLLRSLGDEQYYHLIMITGVVFSSSAGKKKYLVAVWPTEAGKENDFLRLARNPTLWVCLH